MGNTRYKCLKLSINPTFCYALGKSLNSRLLWNRGICCIAKEVN